MDFSEMRRQAAQQERLQAAAQSAAAKRVLQELDADAVERVAASGDAAALKALLHQVLASPEGRSLAEQVKKAVKPDG
ncbi:MAG: hypothetical protein LUC06_02445 [Oscillospiraceae bacterium]|nr:hypothetical protein [Oscillospiraceae bacterium]